MRAFPSFPLKMLCALALLSLGGLVQTAQAEKIQIGNTGVTFEVPEGFTELTPDEIKKQFPKGEAPERAIGSLTRSTTIFCTMKPNIPASSLQGARETLADLMSQAIPGLKWKKNEVVTINGQQWIVLEMESTKPEQDIHNIMVFKPLREQMLILNINSSKMQFPAHEDRVRQCIASLKIEEAPKP